MTGTTPGASGLETRFSSGPSAARRKPRRILIAYSMASTYTSTTSDYLLALKRYSDFDVEYVHVTHDARMNFDINEFDVVINNYCARFPFEGYVSRSYEESLHNFRGLKIIAVQDDYDRTATLHRAIRRLGFHVLLTCIQPEFWHLAYPQSELPGIHIIQGLTGYMPERLVDSHPPIVPLSERSTWLAYRGRQIGAKYGRLGFDKEEIGRRMIELCDERKIPHNIAMDDDSRIYGNAWFEFLGSSRAMLGSQSACNAFDFDGDLEHRIAEFKQLHGREPRYHDMLDVLEPIEHYFDVGQISPRVFECALMRTPMVLFRGNYSNAIEPDRHYIPLERDFSNVDDVFAKLADLELLQGVADRAFAQLVESGRFGYRSLAELLTKTIEEQYPLRVDPAWIAFRAATGVSWRPLPRIEQPETEEEVRQTCLAEVPTDDPLPADEFHGRQRIFADTYRNMLGRQAAAEARLLAEAEASRLASLAAEEASGGDSAAEQLRSRSLVRRIGRQAWRSLPQSLRYKLVSRIKSVVSDI